MKPVTAETIRWLDRAASERFGISGLTLMENAGCGIAKAVAAAYPPCRIAVFSGKGNNGGDGLAAARHLEMRGFKAEVILLASPDDLKPDAFANLLKLQRQGIPVQYVPADASMDAIVNMISPDTALILDAIFGVGLTRTPEGIFKAAINAVNRTGITVISIDLPSGLDSDTGAVHGVAVRAVRTLTLALPKVGLAVGMGPIHAGTVEVVDIGIPTNLLLPYLD